MRILAFVLLILLIATPVSAEEGFSVDSRGVLFLGPEGQNQGYFDLQQAQKFRVLHGSDLSPVTTAGPTVKISRTETISSQTVPNPANTEAIAALDVISKGLSDTTAQTNAISAHAIGTAASAVDALGLSASGAVYSGTGSGIGGYFEGRAGAASARAMGVEIRITNLTGRNPAYSPLGWSDMTGLWLTCNTHNAYLGATICGPAVSTGGISPSKWNVGYAVTHGSVKDSSFRDDSQSQTSIDIRGTHSTAINVAPGAGTSSFGGPVLLNVDGTMKQVEIGPADSCGAGYRCLKVRN